MEPLNIGNAWVEIGLSFGRRFLEAVSPTRGPFKGKADQLPS